MRTWALVEAPAYRIRAACLQWARPSPYAASPIRNIFVEQTEQTEVDPISWTGKRPN